MSKEKLAQMECQGCGKKIKSKKVIFCSNCGKEIFSPKIDRKWHYRTVLIIFIIVVVLYVGYLFIKPSLYFYLDKV